MEFAKVIGREGEIRNLLRNGRSPGPIGQLQDRRPAATPVEAFELAFRNPKKTRPQTGITFGDDSVYTSAARIGSALLDQHHVSVRVGQQLFDQIDVLLATKRKWL